MRERYCKSGSVVGKYRVNRLIEYGSNVLVYEAEYDGNKYTMKELFPEGLYEQHNIARKNGNYVQNKISKFFVWKRVKKEFIKFIYIGNRLSSCHDLKNSITSASEIFRKNNTVYAVYPHENCRDWKQTKEESYKLILKRGADIADIIWKIHKHGWLVVDIKSSNFLIDESGNIKLCDFDSMVRISQIHKQRIFKCSSETAPKELLYGDVKHVNEKSDLYSLAAMLCTKFMGKPYNDRMLIEMESLIKSWDNILRNEFMDLFYEALDDDVTNRHMSIEGFGERIRELVR